MTVLSPPIPLYQNLPIEAQWYAPSQFFISAVTLGIVTIVTTTENMNFSIGQQIRLLIPPTFGCRQLNGVLGYVLGIPAPNQVTLNIDSSMNVDPFILSNAKTQAQIIPVGDINQGATNYGRSCNKTFIPGSFINISPKGYQWQNPM